MQTKKLILHIHWATLFRSRYNIKESNIPAHIISRHHRRGVFSCTHRHNLWTTTDSIIVIIQTRNISIIYNPSRTISSSRHGLRLYKSCSSIAVYNSVAVPSLNTSSYSTIPTQNNRSEADSTATKRRGENNW